MKTEIEEHLEKSHLLSVRLIKRFCDCFPDVLYNDLKQPVPVDMLKLDNMIKKFEVMFEWKIAVIHGYLPFGECLHLAYSKKFRTWLKRLKPGTIVTSFGGVQYVIMQEPERKNGEWEVQVCNALTSSQSLALSLFNINPRVPVIKPKK